MKILTFDVEDWFHILDHPATKSTDSWNQHPSRLMEGVDAILELLSETNQRATFFCLGWVAEHYPNVIKAIDREGHHIGTHSYSHQLAYEQTREEFRQDLKRSMGVLEDAISKPIDCYRAPGFSITSENLWAFEILIEEGISVDCSLFPASRAHGGLPSMSHAVPSTGLCGAVSMRLFPINTKAIFGRKIIYSGGGYFRLFPGYLIDKWMATDRYVMTYFHPRDFDSEQPLIPGLTPFRRFKTYVGIRGAKDKLFHLLSKHSFMDVASATNVVDWETAPTIDLRSASNSVIGLN